MTTRMVSSSKKGKGAAGRGNQKKICIERVLYSVHAVPYHDTQLDQPAEKQEHPEQDTDKACQPDKCPNGILDNGPSQLMARRPVNHAANQHQWNQVDELGNVSQQRRYLTSQLPHVHR